MPLPLRGSRDRRGQCPRGRPQARLDPGPLSWEAAGRDVGRMRLFPIYNLTAPRALAVFGWRGGRRVFSATPWARQGSISKWFQVVASGEAWACGGGLRVVMGSPGV